jgi:hypothetical protein
MKPITWAIAALAAALSTAAFAGDAKSTRPTPMTDEQMDQVTAGVGPGHGVGTAITIGAPVEYYGTLKPCGPNVRC